jgi:hypothetical protein
MRFPACWLRVVSLFTTSRSVIGPFEPKLAICADRVAIGFNYSHKVCFVFCPYSSPTRRPGFW